jgi:hypothetical protein
MNETDYWQLIRRIGWGTKTTDYKKVAIDLYKQLGKKEVKKFQDFVRARRADLVRTIHAYEYNNGSLNIGSDDGFMDVTYHVVGLGYTDYMLAIHNPKLIEKRYIEHQYTESFAYCFLEPDPERTEPEKQKNLDDLIEDVISLQSRIKQLNEVVLSLSEEVSIVVKMAKQALEDKKTK